MTSNPNLVATPVVDKNGKATTVYRKADKKVVTASIPAPRTAKKVTPEEALQSAIERLADGGFLQARTMGDLPTSTYTNLSNLSLASPETMSELTEHILNAGEAERGCWEWTLLSQTICHTNPATRNGRINFRRIVRTRMAIQPLITRIAQHHPEYATESVSESIIYQVLGRHTDKPIGAPINEARLKADAIHIGITVLSERGDIQSMTVPADDSAVDFIEQNLGAVEPIIDELAKRRTADPEVIKQLTDTHAGLTEGVL